MSWRTCGMPPLKACRPMTASGSTISAPTYPMTVERSASAASVWRLMTSPRRASWRARRFDRLRPDTLWAKESFRRDMPAAELCDREDAGRRRIRHRSEAVFGERALRVIGLQIRHERLGHVPNVVLVRVAIDDRRGIFDQHGLRRQDDLVRPAAFHARDELILICDDRVADAALERRHRLAAAFIHD